MIRHTIRLDGPAAHGARVSMRALREIADALLEVAQRSLRLRVEGRSNLQGKPDWLDAATDVEMVGIRENCTVLELEAPTLEEAAPQIFERLPLWETGPRREQTAVSLVEETMRHAIQGNADSDLLDRSVLDAVAAFGRILDLGFERVELDGFGTDAGPVEITLEGLRTAERLRLETPPAERTIVAGLLDQLRYSDRAFRLVLPSGQTLNGLFPSADPAIYAPLWGKKVVVDGEARFRPSGTVSVIAATHLQEAGPTDTAWERVPRPATRHVDELRPHTPPPLGSNGMQRVFGQWPGDETEEELLAALRAMG